MIFINFVRKAVKHCGLIGIAVVLLFSLICLSLTFLNSFENNKFNSEADYEIVNKWYDKKGSKINISNMEIMSELTLHSKLHCHTYKSPKLIIQTINCDMEAFVAGKKLYQNTNSKFGSTYNIIDISDVTDDENIYIRLSPNEKTNGKIGVNSYLTTNNDFLFSLLHSNKPTIIILCVLCFILFIYGLYTVRLLVTSKRKAARHLHACCIVFLTMIIILSSDALLQFFIGNSTICYAIKHISYTLLPVELIGLYQSAATQKEKAFYVESTLCIFYALLRAMLFVLFKAPLENGVIISHLILISIAVQMICYLIKNISNNIQKRKAESCCS